jgi:hypothetical protein
MESLVKLTAEDVRALELRCPRFCTPDAEEICGKIDGGYIFGSFSESERLSMKAEVLSIDHTLPSLHTFFRDISLLITCATGIKQILRPGDKTIRATLKKCFRSASQHPQSSAVSSPPASSFGNAVQTLWIFAMKHFQRMPNPSGRTDSRLLAKTLIEPAHDPTVCRLSKLMQHLGFQSPEIELWARTPGDGVGEKGAEAGCNTVGEHHPTTLQQAAFSTLVVKAGNGKPRQWHEKDGRDAPYLKRRCGCPRNETYQQDREFLTKETLHFDFSTLAISGPDIASFFVLRCQYLAFFVDSGMPLSSSPDRGAPPGESGIVSSGHHLAKPFQLGESIMGSRRYSDDSNASVASRTKEQDVSSMTSQVVTESPGSPTAARVVTESLGSPTTALNMVTPEVLVNPVVIQFKKFEGGTFHTVKEVNIEDPVAVEATAKAFMRDSKMKLYSVGLHPIHPDECLEVAVLSGVNSVILLPEDNLEISIELRRAACRLR